MRDTKASIQLCMQACAHMHPDPTLRIMAVVTACCQEARLAQRKFTPILLFIAILLFITAELVMDMAHPARHSVSVIAWVWREAGKSLEVRVRVRAIDSGRGTRSSNKLESISTVRRWCCKWRDPMGRRSTS